MNNNVFANSLELALLLQWSYCTQHTYRTIGRSLQLYVTSQPGEDLLLFFEHAYLQIINQAKNNKILKLRRFALNQQNPLDGPISFWVHRTRMDFEPNSSMVVLSFRMIIVFCMIITIFLPPAALFFFFSKEKLFSIRRCKTILIA